MNGRQASSRLAAKARRSGASPVATAKSKAAPTRRSATAPAAVKVAASSRGVVASKRPAAEKSGSSRRVAPRVETKPARPLNGHAVALRPPARLEIKPGAKPAPVALVPKAPVNGRDRAPVREIKPLNGKAKLNGSAAAAQAVKPIVIRSASAPAVPVKITKLKRPLPPPPLYTPPPAQRMTTDTKPRKNQAGLSSKEIEFFRHLLFDKRREIVGDMGDMESEALRSGGSNLSNLPVHMADQGTDNYEQEFTLGLVEKERQLLGGINRALAKIQDGTYGICEGTGKPISKPRLEAQPWAKYSIEYARLLEKNVILRR